MGEVTEVNAWVQSDFIQTLKSLEISILLQHFSGFRAARWEWSRIQGALYMVTILLPKCLVKMGRLLFRLNQRLRCVSITKMDTGWTITIFLWIVSAPRFELN